MVPAVPPVALPLDVWETGTVLLGLIATTNAGSAATAAVLAALRAAVVVPLPIAVNCVPPVKIAFVAAPVGRGRAAALIAKVPVPALAVTVPATVCVEGKLDTETTPLLD